MRRTDLAFFKDEDFAAPMDGVINKTGEPDSESHEIAQRHQPKTARHSAVMHNSNPNFERHRRTQGRSRGQRGP